MNSSRFNYIITIHNKENLIDEVLGGIAKACTESSAIYPVLDGCTDNSEKIIDNFKTNHPSLKIIKIHTPDVHELLSINAGLKRANQDENTFNIILQDDVILNEPSLEKKIVALYKWGGKKLGHVSFRLGANFTKDAAYSKDSIPQTDYIENVFGAGLNEAIPLKPGNFSYRDIAIKSPVCIPGSLLKKIGYLEEKLAPYGHDDLEYAIRCHSSGYKNGVFALEFRSDIKWGGTRMNPHPQMQKIIERNIAKIRSWYWKEMVEVSLESKDNKIYCVPGLSSKKTDTVGLKMWNKNKKTLRNYLRKSNNEKNANIDTLSRIVNMVYKLKNQFSTTLLRVVKKYTERNKLLKIESLWNKSDIGVIRSSLSIEESNNSIYIYQNALLSDVINNKPQEALNYMRSIRGSVKSTLVYKNRIKYLEEKIK